MKDDNRQIMQYFSCIHELAETINRSDNYVGDRLHKRDGKDFTKTEWKLIEKHIAEYKAIRDSAKDPSKKEDALRAIQKHLQDLGEIIGDLLDEAQ